MDKEELVKCIDINKEKIIECTQEEAKNKKYFNEYPSSPDELIFMAANDTIEALKVIIQLEKYTIFKNKMTWFKSMSESRKKEINMKAYLIEFMIILKSQIEKNCIKDERVDMVFDNMIHIIEEEF